MYNDLDYMLNINHLHLLSMDHIQILVPVLNNISLFHLLNFLI
ncbi:hypothetical protein LDVICp191 [lymphocystis disease virus-China]|uniref:Uncharacterized protein n=1 Tax=lymphocystis disease virus-China TaxID=256729 RepID=Q677S3_9VIRU|nr:hypothetical protein LDVICp191 [lymphocystis disease virus-China]AAU11034.1 hypothetical protein [lymphocystis disease virus-China]